MENKVVQIMEGIYKTVNLIVLFIFKLIVKSLETVSKILNKLLGPFNDKLTSTLKLPNYINLNAIIVYFLTFIFMLFPAIEINGYDVLATSYSYWRINIFALILIILCFLIFVLLQFVGLSKKSSYFAIFSLLIHLLIMISFASKTSDMNNFLSSLVFVQASVAVTVWFYIIVILNFLAFILTFTPLINKEVNND